MSPSTANRMGLLVTRVQRRLHRTLWTRQARREDQHYAGVSSAELEQRLVAPAVAATWPGPDVLPHPPQPVVDAARADAHEVLHHRFRIFGQSWHSAARNRDRTSIARLARELGPAVVERYEPIEWHTDFASGFRWDPAVHYLDVRVAPAPGVDIKVPRELSRFQHVGPLFCSSLPGAGEEFVLEVLDWIDANPPRRGVNWASAMDVAIRAVNWIWGLRLFARLLERCPHAASEIRRSLYEHGLQVSRNLEYYEECTTNHYLANVAGLIYIGAAFPEFPESDTWLRLGMQELVSESVRQLYDDGGDFEASTHYHRLVAEMFLSCAALVERLPIERRRRLRRAALQWNGRPPVRPAEQSGLQLEGLGRMLPWSFYERVRRAVGFTAALSKPDGRVPQFGDNDSARLHKLAPVPGDDSRDHRHLVALGGTWLHTSDVPDDASARFEAQLVAGDLPPVDPPASVTNRASPRIFPDAGIAVLREGPLFVAVTCGPNGQGGRGGHGHNDKLSFELTVSGTDFIVDGGCPSYTGLPQLRNQFRSTAAHSTIAVEGVEQDVWKPGVDGLFRLPERSSPRLSLLEDGRVAGSHDGYGTRHERVFTCEGQRLVIEDRLAARGRRLLVWTLAPEVTVCSVSSSAADRWLATLTAGDVSIQLDMSGVDQPFEAEGFFARGYGERVPSRRLLAPMMADTVISTFTVGERP